MFACFSKTLQQFPFFPTEAKTKGVAKDFCTAVEEKNLKYPCIH